MLANLDRSLRPGVQPARAARARRAGLTRDDAYRIVQEDADARAGRGQALSLAARGGRRVTLDCRCSSTRPSASTARCATPASIVRRDGGSRVTFTKHLLRQGARHLRRRRRALLLVASDRMSAFDVVMAEAVPDKGRVLTAMTPSGSTTSPTSRPNHLISTDLADCRRGTGPDLGGADDARAPGRDAPDRVHRARLPRRARRGRSTRRRHHARHAAAGRAAGVRPAARARVHARRPRRRAARTTRTSPSTTRSHSSGGERRRAGRERSRSRVYAAGAAARRGAGHHHRRHQVRARLHRRRARAGDEVLTPDSSRFWPADEWKPGITPPSFDKQPVRDYLEAPGWDKTPPPPPLPAEVVAATPRALRRGLRAHHRPSLRRLARRAADAVTRVSTMRFSRARRGVSCGPASPIRRAPPSSGRCRRSGFDGVDGRAGRQGIRFTIDAADEAAARGEVEDLCERFLTNPVIEDAVVTSPRAAAS